MSDFESFEQERSEARESEAALPRDPQPVPPADGPEAENHPPPANEDHEGADEGEPLRPRDWQGDTREILEGLANEHTDEHGTESPNSHAEVDQEDVAAAQPPSRRKERCLVQRRTTRPAFTLEQRLLILDAWRRSALPRNEP